MYGLALCESRPPLTNIFIDLRNQTKEFHLLRAHLVFRILKGDGIAACVQFLFAFLELNDVLADAKFQINPKSRKPCDTTLKVLQLAFPIKKESQNEFPEGLPARFHQRRAIYDTVRLIHVELSAVKSLAEFFQVDEYGALCQLHTFITSSLFEMGGGTESATQKKKVNAANAASRARAAGPRGCGT